MNKLFTKVATLCVGLAMAAGVGVALGSAKASATFADTQSGSINLSSSSTNTGDDAWDMSGASGYYTNNNGAKLDATGEYVFKNGIFSGNASTNMSNLEVTVNGKINGTATATNSYKVEAISSNGTVLASDVKTGASVVGTSFAGLTFTISSGLSGCTGIKVTYAVKGGGNWGIKGVSWTATYSSVAPSTFTVTYNGNGATSGTAPVDSTVYDADNNQVTVLGAGDLEKTNFKFGGWTDGTSTFAAGDTFTISNNVTLNAVWILNTEHAGTQQDPYSIADARLAIDNGGTVNQVYVTGIISQIDKIGTSGGITYWISDDGTKTNQFEIYYGKNIGNVAFSALTDISLGATVVNFGNITKYNTTYEFSDGSYLISYVAPANPSIALSVEYLSFILGGDAQSFTVVPTSFSATPTVTIEGASHVSTSVDGLLVTVSPLSVGNDTLVVRATNNTEVAQIELDVRVFATHGHVEDDPYTVGEALALIASDQQYVFRACYVKGLISKVVEYLSNYKSISYNISDTGAETDELYIYSGKGLAGADFSSKDDLTVGYEVVLKGDLKFYSQKSEMDKNSVQISYKNPVPTEWTEAQEDAFKDALDGLVPHFFGAIVGDISFNSPVEFTVGSDVVATANEYFENSADWTASDSGWVTLTTNGEVYVSYYTVAGGTKFSYLYTEYFTIKYLPNGGDGEMADTVGAAPEVAACTFTKEGYHFVEWNTSDDGQGTKYEVDQEVSANVTLYAIWEQNAQTAWTTEQENAFKTALQGFVPPFWGPLYDEDGFEPVFNNEEFRAVYYIDGDVESTINQYVANWIESGQWHYKFMNHGLMWVAYAAYGEFTYVQFDFDPGYFEFTFVEGEHSVTYYDEEGASFALPGPSYDAPEGQQFKSWSDGTTEYAAGAQYTLIADVVFTAQYEDKPLEPLTDWTDSQKATFANYLKGGVPPFLGDEFAHGSFNSSGTYTASAEGDFKAAILAKFEGTQWNDELYEQYGQLSLKTTYGYDVVQVSVSEGDNPVTTVKIFYEQTEWTADQLASFKFAEKLDGFVPTYHWTLANLQWSDVNGAYVFMSTTDYRATFRPAFQNSSWTAVPGETDVYRHYTENGTVYGRLFSQSIQGATYYIVMIYYIADPIPTTLVVDASAVKPNYYVGDELDPTGIAATILDENGDPINYGDFTPYLDYDYDFSEPGVVTVTVSIEPKQGVVLTDTFEVNVAAVELTGIEVVGEMSKTSYTDSEQWSTSGLTVNAVYNNGNKVDVTDQATWTFDPEKPAEGVTSVSAVASFGGFDSDAVVTSVTVSHVYDADAFAKELLEKIAPICANYDGKKNNKTALNKVWQEMALKYETLSDDEKAKVVAAAAKADGTDLEKAMAFYNYACKKYGLTKFIAGRQVKAIVNEPVSSNSSILPIIVIVASSVAAVTAIGVIIALKRRKNLLSK